MKNNTLHAYYKKNRDEFRKMGGWFEVKENMSSFFIYYKGTLLKVITIDLFSEFRNRIDDCITTAMPVIEKLNNIEKSHL